MTNVVIVVQGGVAEVVIKPVDVSITIYDYDITGANDKDISVDINGKCCIITTHAPDEEI